MRQPDVYVCQLLNKLTSFHGIWHENCARQGRPKLEFSNNNMVVARTLCLCLRK